MRAVVVTERDGPAGAMRQAALAAGLACGPDDCVTADALPARLRAAADLLLVAVGPDGSGEAAVEYAARHTGLPVYAVGSAADGRQVLRSLKRGARGYLDSARLADDLPAVADAPQAQTAGRLVAVLSAVPGSGATSVAAGLAFALAAGPRGVALAELGAGPPALALALDLRPRFPLADLFAAGRRADAAVARHAAVAHPDGAHVLAHSPDQLRPPAPPPGGARAVAAAVRGGFAVGVLDLGHGPDAVWDEVLPAADAVVVVVRPDVPGVRLGRLLLDRLADAGTPADAVHLVANRFGRRGLPAWRDAEAGLGRAVAAWLPDCPALFNRAVDRGRPVTAARWSAPARRLRKLAHAIRHTWERQP